MDTDLRLLPLAALVAATLSLGAPVALAEDPLDQEIILIDEDAAGADTIVIEDEEAGADIIVIEDEEADAEVIVVDETEAAADEIVIETEEAGADQIVVEEEPAGGEEIVIEVEEPAAEEITVEGEEIVIEPAPAETIELVPEEEPGTIMIEEAAPAAQEVASGEAAEEYGPASPWSARADKLRLEAAPLVSSSDDVDVFGYGSAELSLGWDAGGTWEARLAGRADGYVQTGDPDFEEADLDYGESFVRYRGDKLNVTLGTQTVIWGRIDEIPPTDRSSVQDLTRFILDDLQDRRRARPMLRVEAFQGENKLDLTYMPTFREAELPDKDSIWYPIDRRRGEVLGLESTPLLRQVVRGALIDDDAPDSDNAFGLRFTRSLATMDYALTVQQGRQSIPYYRYDAPRNTLEAKYPSAWSLGGDIGFEAAGVTWRFEAVWISDVPVTREDDYRYEETEGVNWAVGAEFYPGDADTRVNLQFASTNLYDAPDVLDRDESYNFNGEIEIPFAQDRWRASMRFFAGLDEHDVYVNPEIEFLGWQPHSFYAAFHYFDGANGTIGGFHQEHSVATIGWRAEF